MCFKKLLPVILVLMMFASGCSQLNRWVYKPNINQGNYLSPDEITKIHEGMTQKEVISILGSPVLSDPFDTKTWFYVFRQKIAHKQATQHTLILKFNESGQLLEIKNKPELTSSL